MTLSEYTEAVLLRQGDTQSKQPYHALQRRLARILRTVQVGNHKEIPWKTASYHWRDFGQRQPHGQRGISQALSVLWHNADSVHGHWDDIRRGKTSNRLDFPLWQRGSCEDWGSSVKRDDRQHISQYLPEYGQEMTAQLWAGGALRRNAGDYGLQPRNRQVSADNLFPYIQGALRLYAVWHHSNENSERYDRGWKGSFNVFEENDGINYAWLGTNFNIRSKSLFYSLNYEFWLDNSYQTSWQNKANRVII